MRTADVVVVGGGIVGLSVGWRVARSGRSVVVVDPAPGRGVSSVAAGMLAPVTEARAAEAPLSRLGLASLRSWPRFADELAGTAGLESSQRLGFRTEGTMAVAFDEDDRRAIDELAEVHIQLGLSSKRLSARECRERVRLLSPRIRGGLLVSDDWQVDPRQVVAALGVALEKAGASMEITTVKSLLSSAVSGPVTGVELGDGTMITAADVVVAAGLASGGLSGLPSGLNLALRPVKGELLRLRSPEPESFLPMTLRAVVQGQEVYVVPRDDGEVVVGASMQEAGHDTSVRAGAVMELLRAAIELVPALSELFLEESLAGLRPATGDNGPYLGPTTTKGLHVAAGHFRNGVLLSPITAETVLAGIEGRPLPEEALAFSPERFS